MTNSINKGKQNERNVVNLLKEAGIPAKRISMMETGGIDKGDIEFKRCATDNKCLRGQVKAGSHVPSKVYKFMENGEEVLFMKRDRKEWLVAMKLDTFIENFM